MLHNINNDEDDTCTHIKEALDEGNSKIEVSKKPLMKKIQPKFL